MKEIAKEFANVYKQLARAIQVPGSGQLFPTPIPDCTSLLLNFSSKTLENLGLKHSFSRLLQVHTGKDRIKVVEPLPNSFENPGDLKIKSKSPSGKLEVRIRKPSINGKEVLILEIWEDSYLMKTKDITKTIKLLYNDPMFGEITWSKDESLISFTAEPADKNYAGVWEEQEKPDEKDPDPLEKYTYKEDFGDQMAEKTNPRLYIFDVKELKLEEVIQAGDSAEYWPGIPLFLEGNELLFFGYKTTGYKEGLIYCFNRPSALYYLKDYKNKEEVPVKITDEYMVFGVSIASDYKKLAYLAAEKDFIEHNRCLELRVIDWPKKSAPQIVVPIIDSPKDLEFPGIYGYHDDFNAKNSGFLADKVHYILNSISYGHGRVYLINTNTKKVVRLHNTEFETDEQIVLAFKDDIIILNQSSINVPPYNVAIKLDFEGAGDTESLVKSAKWCKFNETKVERTPELFNMLKSVVKKHIKTPTAEGYLYYPEGITNKGLIAILHGGPHGSFINNFNYTTSLYSSAGYATLLINYRGSIGYGQSYVTSLLGHIGEYDVTDCMECIEEACKQAKDKINTENIFVSGGSHGGFLAAWLIARHPKYFKAAIVRNPVIDVSFMTSASDIPDWGFAEVLNKPLKFPPDESERKKLWEHSPMSQLDKIETPLLLMVGAKDRRVPMANVLPLYNYMKTKGKEVKLLQFPNDNHTLYEPETEVHSLLNGLAWFDEHRAPK